MRIHINLMKRVARFLRQERGTQMVELAISLPLLLMLFAATAEFGRYFYTYATLTNAVRAGARHASKWQIDASWTKPETKRMVVYGDFSSTSRGPIVSGLLESHVQVQANGVPPHNIDSVTVSIVGYQYQPLFDLGKLTGIEALSMRFNVRPSYTMKQIFNGPVAH